MKKNQVVDVKSEEVPSNLPVASWANNIMVDDEAGSYYSLAVTSKEDKVWLYNAINNPDKRLADMINMELHITHVLVEMVELEQEETGELQMCPRIILIDKDKVSYQCVSVGVFSGLKKIFKLFGEPSAWTEPVKVRVKQITKGKKQMLSLEVLL